MDAAEQGVACTKDFVIIPHPFENGAAVNTERFCGNGFVTKTCKYIIFCFYIQNLHKNFMYCYMCLL